MIAKFKKWLCNKFGHEFNRIPFSSIYEKCNLCHEIRIISGMEPFLEIEMFEELLKIKMIKNLDNNSNIKALDFQSKMDIYSQVYDHWPFKGGL